MRSMKKEEIEHLAHLARIRLNKEELASLETELPKILDYVSVVSSIAADEADSKPEVGARYNVFRQDHVTNQPAEFTKDMLAEMPDTKGEYLKVKKILQTDE